MAAILQAACLILFPILFIVLAGTNIHPNAGFGAQGIRMVAQAAGRWQFVHTGLILASLLALGTVLILRTLIVRTRGGGPIRWTAEGFAAVGVAGAAMLSGVVLIEVGLVAPLSEACAAAPSCLEDPSFTARFAEVGWANIIPLGVAGGLLLIGLMGLAIVGWISGGLRWWEGLAIVVGGGGIAFTNPGFHGPAAYGLLFILFGTASIARRLLWPSRAPAEAHPAPATTSGP